MRKHFMTVWILCGVAMIVSGCSSHHYKVNDPASGKSYYTNKVDEGKGGAVKFKDEKSGSTVTLQSSEVKTISSDEFDAAVAPPSAPKK